MNKTITILRTFLNVPFYKYDVKERLSSGREITHMTGCTLSECRAYINKVWINSVPPNIYVRKG